MFVLLKIKMTESRKETRIVGIGVDIEKVERFNELKNDKKFLSRTYTEKELEYCFSDKNTAQHLAARFAGKEAVIKALSSFGKKIAFKDIEILNKKDKAPFINGIGGYKNIKTNISLSHNEDTAIAFVIAVSGE